MGLKQDIYVAVDNVVIANNRMLLLIKRKNEPFKGQWALPGGFVEEDEDLPVASARELREETGLEVELEHLKFVSVYGKPGRDPRFRTISIVYRTDIQEESRVKGADDADEAEWFDLNDLPSLGFDHDEIVSDALKL